MAKNAVQLVVVVLAFLQIRILLQVKEE